MLLAELAVPVEVRAQDVGARVVRVWRLARAVGIEGLELERGLPFEPGRRVRAQLTLPDDRTPISVAGIVELLRAAPEGAERPPPALIVFSDLAPEARERLIRYVEERTLTR